MGSKTPILAASTQPGQTEATPHPGGLYAISSEHDRTGTLVAWAAAVLDGGAAWVQYRDKRRHPTRRREQAQALVALCRERGARLIVNDDVELAVAVGADGVHLGRDDGDPTAARRVLGAQALVGVSCYADLARARAMAARGASYLAFGAFFPSSTKPGATSADPALLRAGAGLGLPLVAIGGITPDNGRALVEAGAHLLAVVGGLAGPPEVAGAAARRYAALFHRQPPTPP